MKGKIQQGSRGEYLYLQSKAGVGAARAAYSLAYPQYRRETERSVQAARRALGRSQLLRCDQS